MGLLHSFSMHIFCTSTLYNFTNKELKINLGFMSCPRDHENTKGAIIKRWREYATCAALDEAEVRMPVSFRKKQGSY